MKNGWVVGSAKSGRWGEILGNGEPLPVDTNRILILCTSSLGSRHSMDWMALACAQGPRSWSWGQYGRPGHSRVPSPNDIFFNRCKREYITCPVIQSYQLQITFQEAPVVYTSSSAAAARRCWRLHTCRRCHVRQCHACQGCIRSRRVLPIRTRSNCRWSLVPAIELGSTRGRCYLT